MVKESALVICPGRGTYNATELGYLRRYHGAKRAFLDTIDEQRRSRQQTPVTELDSEEKFRPQWHTTSENASALIYACALADYADIDRDRYNIVAITGNSMGWYLALAAAGSLDEKGAIDLVNGMGSLMQQRGIGGQVIYPLVNEQWQSDPALESALRATLAELGLDPDNEIYTSIELGGMRVLAANEHAIGQLLKTLPPAQNRFPFRLPNHAAFHSPLLQHISKLAMAQLPRSLLHTPRLPLIDGRGHIWQPYASDVDDLYRYTLVDQVQQSYDYSTAVAVGVKEFAPDRVIILGPGSSLGPPTAQALIRLNWRGLSAKSDFTQRQQKNPFVLAMGIESQRRQVVGSP